MREVANWKKSNVSYLTTLMKESDVVGIVRISGIPGPQIQKMRRSLRGKAELIVAKNNLIERALKETAEEKKGLDGLLDVIDGQCAIITTDMNPFKLYKNLEATKTAAPAKGGELAPDEIEIKAGDTPFKPGPIVGDFQKAGIPAAIEQGKVVIKKTKVLVKEGEPIPAEVAMMLTKLEIFPLTVGMDLGAAYENGTIFKKDVLAIDEDAFMGNLNYAITGSFNLAAFISYTTPLTIRPLLSKAQMDVMNLALNAGVVNKETIKPLLAIASGKMVALASQIPDGLDDELKAMLSAAPAPSAPAVETKPDDDKKPEEDEEEEVSEEEAAAGLGALFG
ncbi:MAG: 50S ribosomal protein L10 [Thermoplasmata archaeon]|nr:50S ribosomal protein L10 [Thermoplasmata archaeon]